MKKKILHVVESFGGGVFVYLAEMCMRLSKEFDITIAYARRPETPKDLNAFFAPEIKLVELKHASRSINTADVLFFCELKRIVKKVNPDITHLHSSKAGFVGRLAINCRKRIVFYSPHGYAFRNKGKKGMLWYIEKLAARTSSVTIGVSKTEYESALALGSAATYVSNGIDIEKMPAIVDVGLETLKICAIGRVSEQKNPKLFADIADAFPHIQFTWIGEGKLEHVLDRGNITVTGWQQREQTLRLLNEHNIFIMTSLWEGLPIALLEAMYLKKICIIKDIEGTREVIRSGVNGFLAGEPDEFIDTIKAVCEGKTDVNMIRENAHKSILETYNTEKMCSSYIKIYNDAINKKAIKQPQS